MGEYAYLLLGVHGTTKKLKEKLKYLNGFLRGIENPDVLFLMLEIQPIAYHLT